jgi:hypothetical protein
MSPTLVFSAITVFVGCLGFLIAYRQWRTAQNKLKLDLFERRLKAYEAVDKFISVHRYRFGDKTEAARDFHEAIRSVKWLFDPAFADFCLGKVWEDVGRMLELWEEIEMLKSSDMDEPSDPELVQVRRIKINEVAVLKDSLKRYQEEWEEMVTPYMTIKFK